MTAQYFSTDYMTRLTEWLVLLGVGFLATVPVQQLFVVPFFGGALNPFELAYFIILFFLLLLGLQHTSVRNAKHFLFCAGTLLLYAAVQIGLGSASTYSIAKQLRYFFPFVLATSMLAIGLKHISLERALYVMGIAALISAAGSLLLYFFFQDFLLNAIRNSTDPEVAAHFELLLRTGRSPWGNASCVFIAIAALGYSNGYSRGKRFVLGLAASSAVVAALTTLNRTLLIGLLFVACLAPLAYHTSVVRRIVYYLRMSFVVIVLVMGVILLSLTNEQFAKGLLSRFAISVGMSQVVDSAIQGNRDVLYKQYAARITQHFPLGQGLGKPYAVGSHGGYNYTADVSFISFILPFGVPGLFIFGGYLYHIYTRFRLKTANAGLERFRRLMLLVFLGTLIVSLNIDLYSRNNFVVYLTLIALAYTNTAKRVEGETQ